MCLVLDANMFGPFLKNKDPDIEPIHNWLRKKSGKIVYTKHKDYQKELGTKKTSKIRQQITKLRQAGRARIIDANQVEDKKTALQIKVQQKKVTLKSNDLHILALAQAAKAKLLCSNDKLLHQDFKNPKIIGGRVYQNKKNIKLLKKDVCP